MTTLNQAMRTFNQRQATQAALQNEELTRRRVEKLEAQMKSLQNAHREGHDQFIQFVWQRGLRARLRWLLFGKVDK